MTVQERVRKRVVKLFQRKGYLSSDEASDMLSWEHGGFSLDANVLIQPQDRDGLERLIRYCARPIFSGERLEFIGGKLRYLLPKPTEDGQTVLLLKPSELLDKLAALIPPPRRHRHHYHGVLAPNFPLRSKIAALANKEILGPNTPSEKPMDLFQDASAPPMVPNCEDEKSEQTEESLKIQPTQKDRASEVEAETQVPQKKKKEPSKASLSVYIDGRCFSLGFSRYCRCADKI